MDLLHISSAVVWIDFLVILLSKVYQMTSALDVWYKQFGIVAIVSDCLVIVLGILLAQFISPNASVTGLAITSVVIQLIHDFLFYIGVIIPLPKGQNAMIDLFKKYAAEGGYKILLADSGMIAGTVFLADHLRSYTSDVVTFVGLLGAYALTFILYTK
jgi:uncharacterized protein YacL